MGQRLSLDGVGKACPGKWHGRQPDSGTVLKAKAANPTVWHRREACGLRLVVPMVRRETWTMDEAKRARTRLPLRGPPSCQARSAFARGEAGGGRAERGGQGTSGQEAETPKQPSRHLRSSAPYFYPDPKSRSTCEKNKESLKSKERPQKSQKSQKSSSQPLHGKNCLTMV